MAEDNPGGITDADIDALLAEMNKSAELAGSASGAPAPPTEPAAAAAPASAAPADPNDIDALLNSATFADASDDSKANRGFPSMGPGSSAPAPAGLQASPIDLPDLQRAMVDAQVSSIDLLRDVELNVKIELGRSKMLVEDVLKLGEGSVVELDKLAGDPVDVFVNERLVARGEVLVLNDSFCVRVNEIIAGTRDEV
ncbi:MAG: flagellar motor switch protein FliN [Tepidisphaeraceae bacterium]